MQIPLLVSGTGNKRRGAYSRVGADETCLRLNIAKGIGPGPISHADGMPQTIVLIDRQHMQVSPLINRGSNKRRGAYSRVGANETCLRLNIAKGIGPGPISHADGMPQTIVLIDRQHMQVSLLIDRTSDTWGRTN